MKILEKKSLKEVTYDELLEMYKISDEFLKYLETELKSVEKMEENQ